MVLSSARKGQTLSKKQLFITQIIMTLIMAAVMSGLMSLIFAESSMEWRKSWPGQFIIAWPIAFCLTMVAWPASMMPGKKIMGTPKPTVTGSEPVSVNA